MGNVSYTNGRYSYAPETAAGASSAEADAKQRAYLQQVFDARKADSQRYDGVAHPVGDSDFFANEAYSNYNKAAQDLNQFDASHASGPKELNKSQQNWNSALDMTQGRGDATMNDPRIGAALDLLQQHTNEGPYTGAVVNQQANRMADRTAAMAGNQAEALRNRTANSGGNVNDPSFQAALTQADTGRMQQNNADRGDLETQATLNNYREQGNAAGQLGSMRMGQVGMANNQYNQAAQMYANQQQTNGHTNGVPNAMQTNIPKLGYQTPTYSPADWSAVIDAINGSGGNGSSQQPTQAALAPAQNSNAQAGQPGVGTYEPNRPDQFTPLPGPGSSADDYTGTAAQNWAASKNPSKLPTFTSANGKPLPYTYNPGNP